MIFGSVAPIIVAALAPDPTAAIRRRRDITAVGGTNGDVEVQPGYRLHHAIRRPRHSPADRSGSGDVVGDDEVGGGVPHNNAQLIAPRVLTDRIRLFRPLAGSRSW